MGGEREEREGGGIHWNVRLSCENHHKINLITREGFVLNACIIRLLLSTSMKLEVLKRGPHKIHVPY